MSSPEPAPSELTPGDRARLLEVAAASIDHGLDREGPLSVDARSESQLLARVGASFVTLRKENALRGCIGTLEPEQPLVCDVAQNAWRAAFRDPRFAPLAPSERRDVEIHLSILGARRPLPARSEAELLEALRPGLDGLVLDAGHRRATFLPAVWESVADPSDFWLALKRKAGLAPDAWDPRWSLERYEVESIP